MPHRRKLIFLIADGSHARFVEQVAETGAYLTMLQMDGSSRLETLRTEQRDEGAGRSFESSGGARHAVGREDPYRRAKEDFIGDVAKTLNEVVSRGAWEGVVLVAPARLRRALHANLAPGILVVRELAKDLTKTPDHELGDWLSPMALAQAR